METWTEALALAGVVVLAAVAAGWLSNGARRGRPSRARRVVIAALLAVAGAGGLAIGALLLADLAG